MNDYDGFATVQNPQDYMNAPAMIIPPDGDGTKSNFSPPPILRAAIDASREFELLSADEIQAHYAEQNVLQQRISDVVSRLDVEVKMREAARSLSRLHRKPSDASMSPSMATGSSSHGARKRISKIFSGSGGGSGSSDSKDKRLSIGQQQRHSMQAEEEAEISSEKIRHLEQLRFDLSQRKALVDRRIVQHHAAVMARALGGVPLPNHRRLQSGASAMSNLSNTSTSGERQSWVVANTQGKHMRSASGMSAHSIGADSPLTTVKEHLPSSARSSVMPDSRLKEEVNMLAGRIAQAIPGMSPAPQGSMAFISNAFERLLRELTDTRNSAEAYHIQAQHSEERIEFLNRELEQAAGSQSRSVSGATLPEMSRLPENHDAEIAQLRHEMEAEKQNMQQLRIQANQQRAELDRTVRSLEDVTRLAVQYESERTELEQLLSSLEEKTGTLEQDKAVLLQQRLGATQNSSVLCKEFQRIVGDLVEQHHKELRQLHPRLSAANAAMKTRVQQQSSSSTTTKNECNETKSPVHANATTTNPLTTSSHATKPNELRKANNQTSNYDTGSTSGSQRDSMLNSDFSQSPEPLSVHNAIRKPVPTTGLNVPNRSTGPMAFEQSISNPNTPRSIQDPQGYPLENSPNSGGHMPLPASMDSDMSLADTLPEQGEEDLSAPRLERLDSAYSESFSEYSRSSSVYPNTNSAAQSQASVLPHSQQHPNQSQASIARAPDYSFNSNDELL